MASGALRPLCFMLSVLIAVNLVTPNGFAQVAQTAGPPAEAQATPEAAQAKPPAGRDSVPAALIVSVIEGNNAVNSISLLRSVTPIVEVRDQNEFPVEGATVIFTLPEQGPGGTFPGNRTSFSTRSDAQGQAAAPFLGNNLPGKFQITVVATAGNRTGEAVINQTNSTGAYIGPAVPQRSWYKKWYTWAIVGGAVAAATAFAVTRHSGSSAASASSTPVVITVGGPVFH